MRRRICSRSPVDRQHSAPIPEPFYPNLHRSGPTRIPHPSEPVLLEAWCGLGDRTAPEKRKAAELLRSLLPSPTASQISHGHPHSSRCFLQQFPRCAVRRLAEWHASRPAMRGPSLSPPLVRRRSRPHPEHPSTSRAAWLHLLPQISAIFARWAVAILGLRATSS